MTEIGMFLTFPQIPAGTSQMKRVNHRTGKFFAGKQLEEARRAYEEELRKFVPDEPLEGPVKMDIEFRYTTKDKKKSGEFKTSRPDCDNMVKLIQDVMTSLGYWKDDSQVVDLHIRKKWSKCDFAEVVINIEEAWL